MHPMINIALRAARKAGDIIVRKSDRIGSFNIERKQINDYVTDVDHAVVIAFSADVDRLVGMGLLHVASEAIVGLVVAVVGADDAESELSHE